MPGDLETAGLLALLLLTDARTPGRTDERGELVTLEHADRSQWDVRRIREGLDLAAVALPGGGQFALEAGISGLHCQAPDWASTEWASICTLYDRLIERWPSPAARLARIVAQSFLPGGATAALAALDADEAEFSGAAGRQAVAARADILRRLGRTADARAAYLTARSHERNGAVRDFFGRRVAELDDHSR